MSVAEEMAEFDEEYESNNYAPEYDESTVAGQMAAFDAEYEAKQPREPLVFNVQKQTPVAQEEQGYGATMGKGAMRGVQGLMGGVGSATRWLGEAVGSDTIAKAGDEASDYWEESQQKGMFKRDEDLYRGTFMENPSFKRAVGIISEAGPSMLASLGAGGGGLAIAKGLQLGVKGAAWLASAMAGTSMGLLEGAPQYEEAREAGKSIGESSVIGGLSTAGTAILEGLSVGMFLKMLKPLGKEATKEAAKKGIKGFIASKALPNRVVKGFVGEGLQEVSQTIWQNSVKKYGYDATQDLLEGTVEAFIGGAGMGGMTGAVMSPRQANAIDDLKDQGATDREITDLINDANENIVKEAERKGEDAFTDEEAEELGFIMKQSAETNKPGQIVSGAQALPDQMDVDESLDPFTHSDQRQIDQQRELGGPTDIATIGDQGIDPGQPGDPFVRSKQRRLAAPDYIDAEIVDEPINEIINSVATLPEKERYGAVNAQKQGLLEQGYSKADIDTALRGLAINPALDSTIKKIEESNKVISTGKQDPVKSNLDAVDKLMGKSQEEIDTETVENPYQTMPTDKLQAEVNAGNDEAFTELKRRLENPVEEPPDTGMDDKQIVLTEPQYDILRNKLKRTGAKDMVDGLSNDQIVQNVLDVERRAAEGKQNADDAPWAPLRPVLREMTGEGAYENAIQGNLPADTSPSIRPLSELSDGELASTLEEYRQENLKRAGKKLESRNQKHTSQMTRGELEFELLHDRLTGLKNERDFLQDKRQPFVLSIDGDKVKYVNDTFGHEKGGDVLLKIFGDALAYAEGQVAGSKVYRFHGDEYWGQSESQDDLELVVSKAKEYLNENTLSLVNKKTGETEVIKGEFSYGIGRTTDEAEENLGADKAQRELSGEGAKRGEKPGGSLEVNAGGLNPDAERQSDSDQRVSPPSGPSAKPPTIDDNGTGVPKVRHTAFMDEMEQKYGSAALLEMTDEERATEEDLEKTIVSEIKNAYQKEHGDKPVVLTSASGERGVMITPSSKEPGKIQLTYWDDMGFSGDRTFDTEDEAILDAYGERFRTPNPGVLEKLTTTEKFIEGNKAADETERWNREQAEKGKKGKDEAKSQITLDTKQREYDNAIQILAKDPNSAVKKALAEQSKQKFIDAGGVVEEKPKPEAKAPTDEAKVPAAEPDEIRPSSGNPFKKSTAAKGAISRLAKKKKIKANEYEVVQLGENQFVGRLTEKAKKHREFVKNKKPSGLSPNATIEDSGNLKASEGYAWRSMTQKTYNKLKEGVVKFGGPNPKAGKKVSSHPKSAAQRATTGSYLVEFAGAGKTEGKTSEHQVGKDHITRIMRLDEDGSWYDIGVTAEEKIEFGKKHRAKVRKRAVGKAKTMRQWVAAMGGTQRGITGRKSDYKGDWDDIFGYNKTRVKGYPGGFFSNGAMGFDELTDAAITDGWLGPDSTENDLLEAITENRGIDEKFSMQDSEASIDSAYEEEYKRLEAQLERDKQEARNEGASEESISESAEDGIQDAKDEARDGKSDKDPLVLEGDKETPWEKKARLEKEGVYQRGPKSNSKVVFPEGKIEQKGAVGKQNGLFDDGDQKQNDLFDGKDDKKPPPDDDYIPFSKVIPKIKKGSAVRYVNPADEYERNGLTGKAVKKFGNEWEIKWDTQSGGIVVPESLIEVISSPGRYKRPTVAENTKAVDKWVESPSGGMRKVNRQDGGETYYRVVWDGISQPLESNDLESIGLADSEKEFLGLYGVHVTSDPEWWAKKLQEDYDRGGRYQIVEIEAMEGDAITDDPQYSIPEESGFMANSRILVTSRPQFMRDKTAKGQKLFFSKSTNPNPKGQPKKTVQKIVDKFAPVFKGFTGKILIHDSQQDLTEAQLKRFDINPFTDVNRGLFDPKTGDIHLFADGFNSEKDIVSTLLEEIFHSGINQIVPNKTLLEIYSMYKGTKEMRWLEKHYKLNPNTAKGRMALGDEYLAKAMKDDKLTKRMWQKLLAAVNRFLRNAGINVRFTMTELKGLVRNAVEKGAPGTGTNQFAQPASKSLSAAKKSILDNKNFVKWAKNTVVTVDGKRGSEPVVMYHGTYGNFSVFVTRDGDHLGFHFGSRDAALDRLNDTNNDRFGNKMFDEQIDKVIKAKNRLAKNIRNSAVLPNDHQEQLLNALQEGNDADISRLLNMNNGKATKPQQKALNALEKQWRLYANAHMASIEYGKKAGVMPVYLSIKRPFRMKDVGAWDSIDSINEQLDEDYGTLSEFMDDLESKGYDGIVYKNLAEDRIMERDSYIAFHPNQIKSIYNSGEFDGSNPDIRKSRREKPAPKKTKKAYKLFRVKDGLAYALFIDAANGIPVGEWHDADSPLINDLETLPVNKTYLVDRDGKSVPQGFNTKSKAPTKALINKATKDGKRYILIDEYSPKKGGGRRYGNWGINGSGAVAWYAMRPGWHSTNFPAARHIGAYGEGANAKKPTYRRDGEYWAEIEISADKDYNALAKSRASKDIQEKIPTDGWYEFQTNKGSSKEQDWFIGGAIKINRFLSDKEAAEISKAAGKESDLPRKGLPPQEAPKVIQKEQPDDWVRKSYAGKRATTADETARGKAESMLAAGEDENAVWRKTGWMKKKDGWKFEIDDSGAKVNGDPLTANPSGVPLHTILTHPGLFKAYPELRNIDVVVNNTLNGSGSFNSELNRISLNVPPGNDEFIRFVLLHEVQHAIQGIEGFAEGGSSDAEYRRLAGEIEARDTADRRNLTASERRDGVEFPYESQNIPEDQWIYKKGDGTSFSVSRPDTEVRFDKGGEMFENGITGRTNSFMKRLMGIVKRDYPEWIEKTATKWWDKDAAIERVQKELPPQDETRDYALVKSLMGKRFADELKLFDRDRLKPLLKDMAKSKLKTPDIERFLHAEHAPERNLQMKRVNARRYIDKALKNMPEKEANLYKERIVEITDEFLENSINNNNSSINDRRDDYVDMMDELADIDTDALEQELDNEQKTLDNRKFTEAEKAKGTPERLQNRLDNKREKLERFKDHAARWTDVKDRLSGMTNNESKAIIRELGSKDMRRVAKTIQRINNDTLNILHESGDIGDGEYNAMNMAYKLHVPLMRKGFMESMSPTGAIGSGPLGKPLKIAYGSTRDVENIFARVIERHQSALNRKHKLEASRTLYEMVKENPDESRWSLEETETKPRYDAEGNIRLSESTKDYDGDDGVYVKVDGKWHLIKVPFDNKPMMRWMSAIKYKPGEMGGITKLSRKLVRFLANLNTSLSPEFMMTNFMRDLPVAMIHLKTIDGAENAQKAVAKNVKNAIKGIWQSERGDDSSEWAQTYRDFANHGGAIGWMQGYEDIKELSKALEKELAFENGKYPPINKLRKLGNFITAANMAIENGVRVSAYKAMIDGGMTKAKAARAAAGLTIDFTKHGTIGPTMNSFWMFANAGIQGNVRMITALATNKSVQKITAGIVAFGAMSSVMGALMGGDDDDGEAHYDKLKRTNPALFERNMIFMIPGSNGKYFRVPMPYGYNAFYVLGNEIASVIRGGQAATDGMGNIVSAILGTLNPLQSATLAQMASPTLIDPIIQMGENKTWSGGPLMPDKKPFGLPKPDSERYFSTVNPLAKAATKWLNSFTGGDAIKPGLIDVSPETVEMLIETFTGSAGRLVKDTLSLPVTAFSENGLSLNKVPGVRKLISSPSPYVDDSIHRTNSSEVATLIARLKASDRDERRELRKNPLMKMISYHKTVQSRLRKLNKRRRLAEKNNRPARVKEIKERMRKIKKAYNKRYNRVLRNK